MSGGQCSGLGGSLSSSAKDFVIAAGEVDEAPAPATLEAEPSTLFDWPGFLPLVGGLQRLNDVQTVHGLPSGPSTIPGGVGEVVGFEDVSDILFEDVMKKV